MSLVFSTIIIVLFMTICGILLWQNNKLKNENAVLNMKLKIIRKELNKIMADYDGSGRQQASVP